MIVFLESESKGKVGRAVGACSNVYVEGVSGGVYF